LKRIAVNNSGLDINILEAYLKGTLDPKSMHRVEKEALEDPFVAEALEGLSQSAAYAQNLSLLQKQLHERIAGQKIDKKATVITWQRLSIAAAASVVFISVGVLFLMKGTQAPEQNAKIGGIEVQLSPLESDSVPVLASTKLPEREIAQAKSVAEAPVKKVAVPQKVKEEIAVAISDVTPALAKNTIKPQQKEEIVLRSTERKKEPASEGSAMAATALQSRVEDITVPVAQGRAVSPKDGRPISDPLIKPVMGNKPETLAYAQDVRAFPHQALSAALRPGDNALNEVVVAGYGKLARSNSVPVPSVDNAAYSSYLRENNRLYSGNSPDQFVELSFTVDKTGRPEKIKVLKGLEQKYNEEAIRLLADGPRWIAPKKGSNKATLKVYF
jgi:hypothetical protein